MISPKDKTMKVGSRDRFGVRPRLGRLALRARYLLLGLILLLGYQSLTSAHEIPYDLRIQMLLKAEGNHLSVLIRIPMSGLSESDLPLRGPGYLRLEAIEPALEAAAALALLDNLEIFENGQRAHAPKLTQIRVSLSSDKSFGTYDQALSHLQSPRLVEMPDLYWKQQYLDAAYVYEIGSADARFVVHPKFTKLGLKVVTILQFQGPDQKTRAFEIHGDQGPVELDPSWLSAVRRFGASGFEHILGGWDHLLFLVCLTLRRSKGKDLFWMASCFTVAHSLTLISTALGFFPERLWFGPLVEFLIAVSIVLMAVESILNLTDRWRLGLIFLFGLIHGFGFAFALSDSLQFSGSHLLTALFAFNLGVEVGQLVVLGLLASFLYVLFKRERPVAAVMLVSLLVAHTGLHWAEQRYDVLKPFLPTLNWVS